MPAAKDHMIHIMVQSASMVTKVNFWLVCKTKQGLQTEPTLAVSSLISISTVGRLFKEIKFETKKYV